MFGDEDESGLLRRTWRFLHEQGYINTGVLHDDPSQHARESAVLSLGKAAQAAAVRGSSCRSTSCTRTDCGVLYRDNSQHACKCAALDF